MKKTAIVASILLGASLNVHAAYHAVEVMSYVPGTGVGTLTDPTAALGPAIGDPGFAIYTAFNPPFSNTQVTAIGTGGSLTLRLENYVLIDRTPGTFELGVWENVGLVDVGAFPNPNPITGPTTFEFGSDYAKVEVSPDNVNWYALNNGERVFFTLPGNYYANATNPDTAPANPVVADFGKPFTGTLSSFNNKDFAGVLGVLDGSAGGTWLNLDSVPVDVTQIGFVRFSDPLMGPGSTFPPVTDTLEIDMVAINSAYVGAPTPEPASAALLLSGFALCGFVRQRRK
jgi:PEP-CTERM motif